MTCEALSFQCGSCSEPGRTTSASAMALAESINVGLSLWIMSSGLSLSLPLLKGASRMMRCSLAARRLPTSRSRSPLRVESNDRPPEISEQVGDDDRHPFSRACSPNEKSVAVIRDAD